MKSFFKDKHGKWAIIQPPNVLLWAWIILTISTMLFHDVHIRIFQSCILFAWSYLEVISGISLFRKTLGVVVMILVVYDIIKI
jgi:hypothetical protein